NLNDLARSSQNGAPVSGLKCQATASRTCASSRSRACLSWSGLGDSFAGAVALLTGCPLVRRASLRDGVQGHAVGEVEHAPGRDRRRLQGLLHVDLGRLALRLAGREDEQVAPVGAEEDPPVYIIGRVPDPILQVVVPVLLPGLGVEAVEVAFQLGGVDQAVVDGYRADGPAVDDLAA